MNKLARIFGAREPDVSDAAVPYGHRRKEYLGYLKTKSREKETPWGKAIASGGLVGAGLKASDDAAIREAARLLRENPDAATVAAIRRQLSAKAWAAAQKEVERQRREDQRHRETLEAISAQRDFRHSVPISQQAPDQRWPREAPVQHRKCEYCGSLNEAARTNCKNCGAPLPASKLAAAFSTALGALRTPEEVTIEKFAELLGALEQDPATAGVARAYGAAHDALYKEAVSTATLSAQGR